MKILFPILAALLAATPALAQDHSHMGHAATSTASAEGHGQIRKIDPKAGTLTLQHGPIAALKWPSMTMAFVADPALLAGLKSGQKVVFTVQPASTPVITAIKAEPAN